MGIEYAMLRHSLQSPAFLYDSVAFVFCPTSSNAVVSSISTRKYPIRLRQVDYSQQGSPHNNREQTTSVLLEGFIHRIDHAGLGTIALPLYEADVSSHTPKHHQMSFWVHIAINIPTL